MIRNRSISGIFSAASESRTEDMPTANNKKPSGITPRWQVLFGVLVTVILVYILLVFSSPGPLGEHKPPKEMAHEQLTIVMNTFKRNDMMLDAIKFYSTCPVVKHIYITWSEKQPPPPRITARFTNRQHPTVTFRQEPEDSLNNRFHPISGPHNDAIFSVDDDMRVPCEDLDLAYEVWRGSPRSIVGYMPRIHLRRKNGKLEYRCWWRVWWHGLYSIILTKAAILHHDYFELYSQPHHAMVRNLVDRRRNCEDIAMQFLVANTTMLPPIYVKVSLVLISIDASCIWLYIHVEVLLQSKHLAPCFPSGF